VHYVEPYFGGGSVLLQKPQEHIYNHSEVVCDINDHLIRFWLVMSNSTLSRKFLARVSKTPFSQRLFLDCQKALQRNKFKGWTDAAFAFFVVNRQSRQGLGQDFATLSKRRTRGGMNEQVHAWQSAIESLTDGSLLKRLSRVVILSRPALVALQGKRNAEIEKAVVVSEDTPDTFFYLDPPYLPSTRSIPSAYGPYDMIEDDHVRLLDTLATLQGHFLLSGYPSDLYHEAAENNGWRCVSCTIDNKAGGGHTKRSMTECLWMNY